MFSEDKHVSCVSYVFWQKNEQGKRVCDRVRVGLEMNTSNEATSTNHQKRRHATGKGVFSAQDIEVDWTQLLLNRLFIWTHFNSFLSESWLCFIQEVCSNLPEEKCKHLIVLIKLLYFTLLQWCHSVPLRHWTKLSYHEVLHIVTSVILIEHMFCILTPIFVT